MSKKKKEAPEDGDAPQGGKKKKMMIIALVAVLAIGAGAYFFVFSGGSSADAAPAPEPGTILAVDPVAINLAGGSYLKLGLALQYTVEYDAGGGHGGGPVYDGSQALDLAIAQFSGASLSDVQANREALKAALQETIVHAYHDAVMSIYITEYVTQ
ncbi:MAG: fliL [Modestobacter sp.]|nr:fliL [Modestobacter sp.]